MKPEDSAYGRPAVGSIERLMQVVKRSTELDIAGAEPAVVTAVHQGVQGVRPATVDAQPSRMVVYKDADGREQPAKPMPKVYGAILGQLRVAGVVKITLPVRPGTQGLLIPCSRSLDAWSSSNGEPTDPAFVHTHNVGDSFFLPIGNPAGSALVFDANDFVISTDTGAQPGTEPGEIRMSAAGQVTIEGLPVGGVQLGRTAVAPTGQLAMAQALHLYLTQMFAAAPVAAMDGGATFKAAISAYLAANPFTSFATTKLIAE